MIIASGVAWRVNSAAASIAKATVSYPDPAALDSLARYLRPIASAQTRTAFEPVELVERSDFDARPDWSEPAGDEEPIAPQQAARPRWVVSAILQTDTKQMAVVNDAVVVVGSTLPGGARVVAIESDHVVLEEPGGARRKISLNR